MPPPNVAEPVVSTRSSEPEPFVAICTKSVIHHRVVEAIQDVRDVKHVTAACVEIGDDINIVERGCTLEDERILPPTP